MKKLLFILFLCVGCSASVREEKAIPQICSDCGYQNDELEAICRKFGKSLYDYLEKENKLNEVILLKKIKSKDLSDAELLQMQSVMKNVFKSRKIIVIEDNETIIEKGGYRLPSYILYGRLNCYRNPHGKGSYKTFIVELDELKTRMIVWQEENGTLVK
jgi:hypothetical protein